MRKVINHLRKQPENTKRHILHVSMIVLAFTLFSFWVFGLGSNLANSSLEEAKEDLKPFSVLKENAVTGYKSLSNSAPAVLE